MIVSLKGISFKIGIQANFFYDRDTFGHWRNPPCRSPRPSGQTCVSIRRLLSPKRTFEMLSYYFTGLASEEELLAHLDKLKAQDAAKSQPS
jgi:hypothetical protein